MDTNNQVVKYYQNPESRLGYTIFTWDTKHFGYYPDRKPNITEKTAQRLMMDLVAEKLEMKAGERVLDAGCGRGTTSCFLAEKYGAEITGIDIVPFELEIAKKKAAKLINSGKIRFMRQDYSHTDFANSMFDKIFTLETLVHSENAAKTLREFHRLLKPEGKLALFEYSVSPPDEFLHEERKLFKLICKGSAMNSLPVMEHDHLARLVTISGFRVISDTDITGNMLPSLERFYKYAYLPYQIIKRLGLREKFVNTTAGVEFYKMGKKGLIRYRIIIAGKK